MVALAEQVNHRKVKQVTPQRDHPELPPFEFGLIVSRPACSSVLFVHTPPNWSRTHPALLSGLVIGRRAFGADGGSSWLTDLAGPQRIPKYKKGRLPVFVRLENAFTPTNYGLPDAEKPPASLHLPAPRKR